MNQLTRIVLLACIGVTMWGQDAVVYLKQADTQVKAGQYRQAEIFKPGTTLDGTFRPHEHYPADAESTQC